MDLILRVLPAGTVAACAGFRAFMPLFVITYLLNTGNLGVEKINPLVRSWLVGNEPVYYFIAVMAVLEIVGDKFSASANLLEIFFMFLRPIAGIVSCFTLLNLKEPNMNFIGAVALVAVLTVPFQSLKTSTRIIGDQGPFGMYNLTHSFFVDVEAFGGLVLSFIAPLVAIIVTPLVFYFTMEGFKKWRVRLIAGQELDIEFDEESNLTGDFLGDKQLKKIGKKK